MKFTIERDRLNNAVKKAGSVISTRPTVSIMGHFLLDVQANHLVITATGLDQTITLTLDPISPRNAAFFASTNQCQDRALSMALGQCDGRPPGGSSSP